MESRSSFGNVKGAARPAARSNAKNATNCGRGHCMGQSGKKGADKEEGMDRVDGQERTMKADRTRDKVDGEGSTKRTVRGTKWT
eukprot:290552-Prorocentrum_minimum.AAC.1